MHLNIIEINYINAIWIESIILITKSAVPLFVMITGSLLIQEDRYFSINRSGKMILHLTFVVMSWNVINAIYRYVMGDGIKKVLHVLVYGNYWYLYMLFALYLIMPLISMMVKDYKTIGFLFTL